MLSSTIIICFGFPLFFFENYVSEPRQQITHHPPTQSRHQSIAQNMSPALSKYPLSSYPGRPSSPPQRPHGAMQLAAQNNELIHHYASQRSEVTITPTPAPPPSTAQMNKPPRHTLPQMNIPQFAPDLAIAAATAAPLRDNGRHYGDTSSGVSSSTSYRGDQRYGSNGRPHQSPPPISQPPHVSNHYGHPPRSNSPGPPIPPSKQSYGTPSHFRRM